jgi:hypothetical protein
MYQIYFREGVEVRISVQNVTVNANLAIICILNVQLFKNIISVLELYN